MELYFVRHGIALDREACATDEERPLSDRGREKTKKIARQLAERGLMWENILTSPLVRARQTAEIFQAAGASLQVEIFPALAPGGEIDIWIDWWQQHRDKQKPYALIGHQPDLGNWAELLVWGEARGKLILKKAGIIGVKLPSSETPIGGGELFLLLPPKWAIAPSL